MKLENQVINLELAKRLKELDVPQESYFYHHWYKKNRDYEYIDHQICEQKIEEFDDGKWKLKVYSAFTASELGEMLPKEFPSDNKFHPYELNCKWELHYSGNHMWHITYINWDNNPIDFIIYDENEANARAKMLIYLIENKITDIGK